MLILFYKLRLMRTGKAHRRMWNLSSNLCWRLGRTRPGPQYLASVAVIWTEVIKLAVCVVAQARSQAASVTHCSHGIAGSLMQTEFSVINLTLVLSIGVWLRMLNRR